MAMNPVIKFTTLFGLLAVELAVEHARPSRGDLMTLALAAVFLRGFGVFRLAVVLRDADWRPVSAGRLAVPGRWLDRAVSDETGV